MGMGLLGRGIKDIKFLSKCGAKLTVTDLKNKKDLALSLKNLKNLKNIKYVLGRHDLADFEKADFILKAASVPLDSVYIEHAKKNSIPIEMDESLFAKISQATLIGVTGTRGKTTTTTLIYKILKNVEGKFVPYLGFRVGKVYLSGNVKGAATLPLLSTIKSNDIVVLELSSWQLQGFRDSGISPKIAVFTNFMDDHLNYYKGDIRKYWYDKESIFSYQGKGDLLITQKQVLNLVRDYVGQINSQVILANKNNIPKNWKINLLGKHNRENISLAIALAQTLDINERSVRTTVENFSGIDGRLQFVKEVEGIKFYNDTCATIPEALIAALESLGEKYGKRIVLISGGTDKSLDYRKILIPFKKYLKGLILFDGSASEKVLKILPHNFLALNLEVGIKTMKEAFNFSMMLAKKGDLILLSPGAASFGLFKNEFDRGDQFVKLIKSLARN